LGQGVILLFEGLKPPFMDEPSCLVSGSAAFLGIVFTETKKLDDGALATIFGCHG
jgi:hypothetical protein